MQQLDMLQPMPGAPSPPKNGALLPYIKRFPTNKSIEQLFEEVKEYGWLLNNLFQLQDGMWRCNLRRIEQGRGEVRTYFHEYADAYTPQEALAAAIWCMKHRKGSAKGSPSGPLVTEAEETEWLESILVKMRENEAARGHMAMYLKLWAKKL